MLSKIASAALILPISEAIGQLKWSWFHGKRSKDPFDFEIFDKASRGAWGSFLLLIRTKGKSLAAFGALLTILLLAIDTFFQQVTELPERWVLQGNSFLPRTIRYEPHVAMEYLMGLPATQNDRDFTRIVGTFFTSNGTQPLEFGSGIRPEIPVICPTSKCTWPTYQTLGLCSRCVETPQLLTHTCLRTRIDWTSNLNATESSYPNATVCGFFLNSTSTNPILMSGYMMNEDGQPTGETLLMRTLPLFTNPTRDPLWGGSLNFKDVRNPIIDVLIAGSVNMSHVLAGVAPTLHECVLNYCVKTAESAYSFGEYHERIIETFTNSTAAKDPLWSVNVLPDDFGNEQTYLEDPITINPPSSPSDSQKYNWGLSNETMLNTVLVFDRMFPAFTTTTRNWTEPRMRWRIGHPVDIRTTLFDFNPWLPPNNISAHMERMATAMTNSIRSVSRNDSFVVGEAFAEETYISVRWGWLAFPLAMLTFCIIFLTATILKTSKESEGEIGNWKTSAMPTLIYGLPPDARQNLNTSSTWRSSNGKSTNKVKIRLMPTQGWRLSTQLATSPTQPRTAL